ncbi:MAG: N-acetyl-gamma-glutamyl-phosphate reductase [Acutalibacteraceae bacterium]
MKRVFIDGRSGTTGLRIYDRLSVRNDIELIMLSDGERRDAAKREQAINSSDVTFLCLPDDAARQSVSMAKNSDTVIIDTSTAHRTERGWTYGFPEIEPNAAKKISVSKRIAVPGCHASGFIALVKPLIDNGLISRDTMLSCHSVTGYSGGGKKMIALYEEEKTELLCAPRQYGIGQTHKHLKEMQGITGISNAPVFCPIVSDFYSGMEVTVPLFAKQLAPGKTADDIKAVYRELYSGPVVKYAEDCDEEGFLSAAKLSGSDGMEISVFGCDERIILTARYDNLGKGASGAAVQCLNIVMGTNEAQGLDLL